MALATCLLWLPCAPGHAGEMLTWLLRDLPPLNIFEGQQKDRGVVDLLMPQLIASLPEYQHELVRVNRARGMQMLRDPCLLYTSPSPRDS